MKVSLVISTKDRLSELDRCLSTCLTLSGVDEILVYDDGSSDNTYSFVKEKYPSITIHRGEQSIGLINARTKCASLAVGEIIFSIDDDCIFSSSTIVEEILPFFKKAEVAAVTIPCIDVLIKPEFVTQSGNPDVSKIFICSQFRGCAHALRKDIFLALGGYYNNLVRQEEETEYAMRLYDSGYIIRMAYCKEPIMHYHSPVRNERLISYYRMRNQILVNYRLSPTLIMPFIIFFQGFKTAIYEMRRKRLQMSTRGGLDALRQIFTNNIQRSPMKLKNYILFKKLRRKKNGMEYWR